MEHAGEAYRQQRWAKVLGRLNAAILLVRTRRISDSQMDDLAEDLRWVVEQAPQLLEKAARRPRGGAA